MSESGKKARAISQHVIKSVFIRGRSLDKRMGPTADEAFQPLEKSRFQPNGSGVILTAKVAG